MKYDRTVFGHAIIDAHGPRPMTRVIVIHSLEHARAALTAAVQLRVAVTLWSAEGAAGNAGPLWFVELIKAAEEEFPSAKFAAVLDCGDAPGYALAALRAGCSSIRFNGKPVVAAKIKAIARQYGATLHMGKVANSGKALDLAGESDPLTACRKWLSKR